MRANRFLVDMIASADPYYGGKPPLLVDALDRGDEDLARRKLGEW